jgi:endo-1,4-beta-xylanase
MRRRSLLAMGAAGGAAAVLGTGTAAWASPSGARLAARPGSGQDAEPASLRALAAKIGLRIGTALVPQDIDTPSYAAIAGSQFSVVTPGNGMKWQIVEPTQGTFDWSQADQLVAFAKANGQLIRGHTLLWHNQLPDWLTTGVANGTITAPQLKQLLYEHIMIEVTRYRGKIWQWDVANEFFLDSDPSGIDPNNFWIAALGPDIIPQAFRWAHQADPHALLFYNDYNIAGEDGTNAKSDAVYAWLQEQLAAGVPITGIGNQGHLDTQYGFSGALFQQDLERYATTGVKVAITEADVRTFVNNATDQVPTDSLAVFAQPYEYSQMLKAALAVPDVISFTVWGFTDSDSWVPGTFAGEGYAGIYDVNQQPKNAYYELQSDLRLAGYGAPHRVPSGGGF